MRTREQPKWKPMTDAERASLYDMLRRNVEEEKAIIVGRDTSPVAVAELIENAQTIDAIKSYATHY